MNQRAVRFDIGWLPAVWLCSSMLVLMACGGGSGDPNAGSGETPDPSGAAGMGRVIRLDPALDAIVAPDAAIEKLAGGMRFTEGPVWVRDGGYLLFSDIGHNVINKWDPSDGTVTVFLAGSGFTGADPTGLGSNRTDESDQAYNNIGSNGITLDAQGRVVYAAHGDRQIVRLEPDGLRTVLAREFEGKQLNSPNDLVYRSDGSLYFTDPPSGLTQGDESPLRELTFNAVFRLKDGELQVATREIERPNGLAFSPDETLLYVNNSRGRTITQFDVRPDGTLANGRLLIDMNSDPAAGGPDGIKVDEEGNVYATGPGGLWIMTPSGQHIGTIVFPEQAANLAFGDDDGRTLYVTARAGLYRIPLRIPGVRS